MKRRPQISSNEFAKRREQLISMTGEKSITIVPSSDLKIRNNDAEFPFRQSSDFLYLTGFNEPDAVAVFIPQRKEGEYIIFCREKDEEKERWTGRRSGIEGIKKHYAAEEAYPITEIDEILPNLLENCESVYYNMGHEVAFDTQVMSWVNAIKKKIRNGQRAPQEFRSLSLILHDMRLYKSPAEQRMIKHACKTSIVAHKRAMQFCAAGKNEYELEAEIIHEFCRNNMPVAYTSIVGGGENATILHYVDNNDELKEGDLVLIDAGAEHHGYASDITRTFPVNGHFSTEQSALYSIVLAAQKAAIAQSISGNNWIDPHNAAVEVITTGLVDVGILSGEVKQLIKDKAYAPYFMHKTGHWLGLDVHDVGDYKVDDQWRLLEPNMVLTVEPGLYISPSKEVDQKWWGIGIRIEDDILITHKGNEVLTHDLCKEINDIEALMANTKH